MLKTLNYYEPHQSRILTPNLEFPLTKLPFRVDVTREIKSTQRSRAPTQFPATASESEKQHQNLNTLNSVFRQQIKTPNITSNRLGGRARFSLPPALDHQNMSNYAPSSYIAASSSNKTRFIQGYTGAVFRFNSPPVTLHQPEYDEYFKYFPPPKVIELAPRVPDIFMRRYKNKRTSIQPKLPKFI